MVQVLDGSLKNVLVYPDKTALKDKKIIKLFGKEGLKADNMIIQALLDKKNNVTLCRSVEFEKILPKLEKLFDDNDGVMIVDIFYLMVLFHLIRFFPMSFFLMLLVLILKHLH